MLRETARAFFLEWRRALDGLPVCGWNFIRAYFAE